MIKDIKQLDDGTWEFHCNKCDLDYHMDHECELIIHYLNHCFMKDVFK